MPGRCRAVRDGQADHAGQCPRRCALLRPAALYESVRTAKGRNARKGRPLGCHNVSEEPMKNRDTTAAEGAARTADVIIEGLRQEALLTVEGAEPAA